MDIFELNSTTSIYIDLDKIELVEILGDRGLDNSGIWICLTSKDTIVEYESKKDCLNDYNSILIKLKNKS